MSRVICAYCGTIGHAMSRCPDRRKGRPRSHHVTERPRRCACNAAVLLLVDDTVVEADAVTPHRCRELAVA